MLALARLDEWKSIPRSFLSSPVRKLRGCLPSSRRYLEQVRQAMADMEALALTSEEDFLLLGERLQKIYGGTEEISRAASVVAELLAGEDLTGITEGFHSIARWTEERERLSDRDVNRLGSVLGLLSHVGKELADFRGIVRVLNVLCVSTRIESARMGEDDASFEILAGDVRKLAREIEASCGELGGKRELLSRQIEQSLSRMRELEAGRKLGIKAMVDGIRAGLVTLAEKGRITSDGARRVAERYRAISGNIGAVVASLQFHDITRQRIEHAAEAVGGLSPGHSGLSERGRAAGANGSSSQHGTTLVRRLASPLTKGARGRRAGPAVVRDVCALHATQLESAREDVLGAIRAVMANLDGIGRHLREIAADCGELSGSADDLGGASLKGLSEELAAVSCALSDYSKADAAIRDSLNVIGGTLTEMTAFAGSIAVIGIKIRLIALNAIVKACHMGDRGASLGVLAEAIHTLSVNTGKRTDTMDELLHGVTDMAETLLRGESADESGILPADGITVRLEEMRKALPRLNDRIIGTLGLIHSDGNGLSDAIVDLLEGFVLHEDFDRVLGNAVERLRRASEHARSLAGGSASAQAEASLKELEGSYTMARERQIHDRTLAEAGAVAAALPGDPHAAADVELWDGCDAGEGPEGTENAEGDDLGDNVELF